VGGACGARDAVGVVAGLGGRVPGHAALVEAGVRAR
jgi:hypothetical protein